MDPLLTAATAALVVAGLVFVSLATTGTVSLASPHVVRQLGAVAVGVVLGVATVVAGPRRIGLAAPVVYVVSVVLLVVVLLVGTPVNGTRAWLVVGPLRLQPSELAKVALLVLSATVIADWRAVRPGRRHVLGLCVLATPPLAAVLAQPDLGTALVLAVLVSAVMLVAGVRAVHLAALLLVCAALAGAAWQTGLVADHQVDRLRVFVDADASDPQGAGWNAAQARIAVGSGGLSGRPADTGRTALGYVPEAHTDFIFTVVAERTGFVGGLTLLLLYATVLWRGLRVAWDADRWGAVVATGVVAVLATQIAVGVGMTVGLLPVIGLPLPLVSYGGSSMVTTLVMIGLLQAVRHAPR